MPPNTDAAQPHTATQVLDQYEKLKISGRGFTGIPALLEWILSFGVIPFAPRHSVYFGTDHLLLVRRHFFHDRLRRLFYRDIEALRVSGLTRGRDFTAYLVLMLILVALMVPGMLRIEPFSGAPLTVLGVMLVAVVACLVLDLFLGPTCTTRLYTAVEEISLPSLSRWPAARRGAAEISKRVQSAQSAQGQDLPVFATGIEVIAGRHADDEPLANRRRQYQTYNGRLHLYFFLLLILTGVSLGLDLVQMSAAKNALDSLLYIAVMGLACAAITAQTRSRVPQELRILTWTSLGFVLVMSYLMQIIFAIENPMHFEAGSGFSEGMLPVVQWHSLISASLYTALGALGLLRFYRYRSRMPESA